MSTLYVNLPAFGNAHWKAPVVLTSQLPVGGNNVGDVRLAEDTNTIYVWNGTSWIAVATPGAAIAIDGLIGDVSATGPGVVPATVNSVGGQSAASIAAATVLVETPHSGNLVLASPANGSSGVATFRSLVTADLPAGTGTVTSVALTLPNSVFNVSGSPVTTSGTLAGTFVNQSANTVFAGPTSGGSTTPAFRALVAADIPTISGSQVSGGTFGPVNASNLTNIPAGSLSGVVPIANGGTNNSSAYTAGSIIFSNGTSLTQDNANFFWNDTNQSIGIGTNTPAAATFIDAVNVSGATKRQVFTGYGTASLVGFRTRLARGTLGTPTAVQTGDILGFFNSEGYGTSQFPATATGALTIIAGETFTNTSNLTYVTINATPTGAVNSIEAFRVAATGVTLGPQSASTALHQINGGIQRTSRTITANLTVDTTTTDDIILCNNSGAISITLPAPVKGRCITIKDIAGNATTNNISILQHSTEMIEGLASTYVFMANYGSLTITTDGTNWWFI